VDRLAGVATSVVGVQAGRLTDWHGPEPPGPADRRPERASVSPPLLRAAGLEARIEGRAVLSGIDLAVPPGRVLAVLGANGAGKTTLLRALVGLQPLVGGRVELGGADVTAEPPERRYPRVALVVQDPGRHLLCERVDDEVAFGLRAVGAPEALRRSRVAAALSELDLEHLAAQHPRDLSAGQRERVALAAALSVDPPVVLLDEPTRGMDHARRAALAALLRRRAASGRSAVVVTHDRLFAAAAADEVHELRAGRLAATVAVGWAS
jgi:ABC-type sulfate/molybdate transport systems ATPase subunit